MAFYDRMQQTATKLLDRFGAPAVIHRTIGEVFDPVTGATAPGTEEDHETVGVLVKYSDQEIDGTKIRRGDRRLIIAAEPLSIEPTTADRVTANGVQYTIEDAPAANPAGTPIVYYLQVRK